MTGMEIAVAAGCVAVVAGIVMLIVLPIRASRRKRDARLAADWERVRAEAARGPGRLAFVRWVYQTPRTGSKAFIVWDGDSFDVDTWFAGWWRMPQGVYVLVTGSYGWGPHNRNPNTFYVAKVLDVIPGAAREAYQRHRSRVAKRS